LSLRGLDCAARLSIRATRSAVAEKFGEAISGLAVNYRRSSIIEDHAARAAGPAAGDRAPNASLGMADGRMSLRLYNLFAEHRHNLLLLGNLPHAMLSRLPRYPAGYFAVHRIATSGTTGEELIDRKGEVATRYGSIAAAYLIRPDGYVGFRCDGGEVSTHLPQYLTELFGPTRSSAAGRHQ
jgi:hypothetical protein